MGAETQLGKEAISGPSLSFSMQSKLNRLRTWATRAHQNLLLWL